MATNNRSGRDGGAEPRRPAQQVRQGIGKASATLREDKGGQSGVRPRRRKRRSGGGCMTCLTILSFGFIGSTVLLLILAGWGAMFVSKKMGEMPALENVILKPSKETTKIYSANGVKLADLYIENRVYARIDEIPGHLQEAFIAVEDERFFQHHGVDMEGGMRAAIELMKSGKMNQGASTITMQLAKNTFLSNEKTWNRKIKQILIAMALERKYTKQQILEHYLNQVYFGHGAYGVRTAADVYYGKQMKDLTIAECAMLSAVLKAPGAYSPFNNPNAAIRRRNAVLQKMNELGFIKNDEYYNALDENIRLVKLKGPGYENYRAPYFVTFIMDKLVDENGPFDITAQQLYTEGYKIFTTLDMDMQYYADRAVKTGVIAGNLYLAPNRTGSDNAILSYAMSKDVAILGIKSEQDYDDYLDKSIQEYCGICSGGTKDPNDKLCPSLLDAIQALTSLNKSGSCYKLGRSRKISIDAIKHARVTALTTLRVEQGALSSVDTHNGNILAMVGGADYKTNKYNHVSQAQRQPGSSYKPFVYMAAIKEGYSMNSTVLNARICFKTYCPKNYGGNYGNGGSTTFRHALTFSLNIPAVRVGQMVGTDKIIELCRALGINGQMDSTPSLPLGTASVTPLEMSAAYAAISNGGYKVTPVYIKEIKNTSGTTYKHEYKKLEDKVLDDNVIANIVPVMQDVTSKGTGTRARYGRPVAGKTGTTSSFKDAWFVGYSPDIATAVWLGNDDNIPMCTKADATGYCSGAHMPGGHIPAPIWRDYMKHASGIVGYSDFVIPKAEPMKRTHVGGAGRKQAADDATEGVEAGAAPGAAADDAQGDAGTLTEPGPDRGTIFDNGGGDLNNTPAPQGGEEPQNNGRGPIRSEDDLF